MTDNKLIQRKDPSSGVDYRHGEGRRSNSLSEAHSTTESNSKTVASILSGATTADLDFSEAVKLERSNSSQIQR